VGFNCSIIETRPGYALLKICGKNAFGIFKNEAGGHRWQRVPPTEKRGRVHTSTITVAVLPKLKNSKIRINPRDLEEVFVRGSGAGGQHRNKTSTCVVLTHKPTGIKIRIDGGRSQAANRQTAIDVLRARLEGEVQSKTVSSHNKKRKNQIGSGMRGDKIRTVQVRNDKVIDHRSGKIMSFKIYYRGDMFGK
jgi:peptide chain release factor 1